MNRRSFAIGSAVALVVIGAASVGVARGTFRSAPSHTLLVSFPTGDGLVPGSDVFEAGAKIGSIDAIEPQAEKLVGYSGATSSGDRALVTLSIEDAYWPLHDGLTAGIRPKSLLGEKYVDLHDAGKRTYDGNRLLVASADSVPVELDQFINSLDAPTRTATKVLLNDLGAGIAGRGADLNSAIQTGRDNLAHLAVTGQTLNNRDPDLDRIILGLDGVLQKLTQDDQLTQLSQLIDNGQKTLNAIEAEQASFSRGFNDAQTSLTELNQALDPTIQSLRNSIDTLPHLLETLGPEATLLASLGSQLTEPNTLKIFQNAIIGGTTTSGGALEHTADGHNYPIFRICLEDPTQALPGGGTSPLAQNSCQGNGFANPSGPGTGPQPVPASSSARGGNGGSTMAALIGFLGA